MQPVIITRRPLQRLVACALGALITAAALGAALAAPALAGSAGGEPAPSHGSRRAALDTIAVSTRPSTGPALSLDELLDRHARAMGFSRDSLMTRAIHVKGVVEGLGLHGRIESWSEAPLYTWSRIELGPLTLESGYDGKEGWVMDRNGAVRRAEGSEEVNAQLESLVNTGAYVLRHPPLPLQRSLVEPDSLGRPRLALQLMGAEPEILTLDPENWRLMETSWNSGQMEIRTVYEDYQRVDGLWMPRRMRMEMGQGMALTARLQSVELCAPRGREAYRRPPSASAKVIFHGGSDSGWLPMATDGLHILLRGVIDREHEGLLVLDTGAGGSILDRSRLEELGLSAQGELEATGAAGTAAAQLVEIERLELGRAEFPHQSWVTVDLHEVAALFGDEALLGILGYDTLQLVVAGSALVVSPGKAAAW